MKTCYSKRFSRLPSFSIAKTVDFLFGLTLALVAVGALWALPLGVPAALAHEGHGAMVIIRDDCDPNDPAWAAVGGCAREQGDVTFAEFVVELQSPVLAPTSVIGHQAWRNDPSYIEIQGSDFLIARNKGGRVHTFTKVESFGGGKAANPLLNKGLLIAPECPLSTDIPPDHQVQIEGLAEGNHRFQCCLHPWMRAIVKVK